jgi:two-component system response regulator PilR (NtrC family)
VGGTEDIKVEERLICATNRDIEKEVMEERFREDLYYRLKVIPIMIPPLRERREDIPLIAKHFLKKYSKEMKKELKDFSPEAMEFLLQYPYLGNVRELENIVEGAVALESSDVIAKESLPYNYLKDSEFALSVGEIPEAGVDLEKIVAETEMKLIEHALKEAGGVKKKAAEFLNISLRSLRYLISKYDTG